MIYADKTLSQKLERAEARANADFIETRAELEPDIRASWIEVAGTYAMYDGPESPCTQTFGLGLFGEPTGDDMDRMETFFAERGAPVFHEVSPMADPSTMPLLTGRGYQPIELSTVMFKALDGAEIAAPNPGPITTRIISPDEAELWAETSGHGWATEMGGSPDFMIDFGRVSARCKGAHPYLAELDGTPIASGMLFIHDDVAMLGGASTVPEGRNKGAQSALLAARLSHAAEHGCSLAVMAATPGSQSQKNAQRNGFNVAYTRIKWHLVV
jgi:hypothetical protein